MEYVIILGAASDIGKAIARKYATQYNLYLFARKTSQIDSLAMDLIKDYNIDVKCFSLDINDINSQKDIYSKLPHPPQGIILTVGYLGDQNLSQESHLEFEKIALTNYVSPSIFLNMVANDFEKRNQGFIIIFSSVAGDRGRKSNYAYGSAKSGLSTLASGLRNRLYRTNTYVLTVKPGYVNSKMTQHLNLPKLLSSSTYEVADLVFKAHQKKKDVIYIKFRWSMIMRIVKIIPESLFKRLNF